MSGTTLPAISNSDTHITELYAPRVWNALKWPAALAVLAFYAVSVRPFWHPMSDSALYLMLRDNLLAGNGYTLWGHPHVYVPPGFPALLAALKWMGLSNPWLVNVLVMAMTLTACWLAYKSLRTQTTADFALLITLVVALGAVMLRYSTYVISDPPFIMLVWIGVYGCLRGLGKDSSGLWLTLGAVALILSCWVRVPGLCLAGGAGIGLLLERRKTITPKIWINVTLLAAGVVATAVFFYLYQKTSLANHDLPSYTNIEGSRFTGRSLLDWIITPFQNGYESSRPLAMTFTGHRCSDLGPFVFVFWFPVVLGLALAVRRGQYFGACVVVGYVGAILMLRPMVNRYLLPVVPFLLLYFFDAMRFLVAKVVPRGFHATRIARALAITFLCMQIPKAWEVPNKFLAPDYPEFYANRWQPTHETAEYLRRHAGQEARFVSSRHERLLSYFSGVYSIPLGGQRVCAPYQEEDVNQWLDRGVRFAVVVRNYSRTYYANVLTYEYLDGREDFKVVHESGQYRIYEYVPARADEVRIASRAADRHGADTEANTVQ